MQSSLRVLLAHLNWFTNENGPGWDRLLEAVADGRSNLQTVGIFDPLDRFGDDPWNEFTGEWDIHHMRRRYNPQRRQHSSRRVVHLPEWNSAGDWD